MYASGDYFFFETIIVSPREIFLLRGWRVDFDWMIDVI